MLHPNDRQLLHTFLRPPLGDADSESVYQLDWAIGTTYSLDLMTLLGVPLACTMPVVEDRSGKFIRDPLALLKALRECADRICLFCQAGKINVPDRYPPLIQMLEETVVPTRSPRGGNFHPKIWVLRFSDPAGQQPVKFRFLCLTRNLTFDRSWDTLLSLEGDLKDRLTGFRQNQPLVDFVAALPGMADVALPKRWSERWDQIVDEVSKVKLDPPQGFEKLFFHPIGIPGSKPVNLPTFFNGDRLLVVSPFVNDRFFNELGVDRSQVQLISRTESLAELDQEELGFHPNVWILDEKADPEPNEPEEGDSADDPLEPDSGSSLKGLHAKLFVAEQGWNSRIWTGSANATSAAFERNVEFLVELRGKRSFCGIDAILGEHSDKGASQHVTGIRDLLTPYIPSSNGLDTLSAEIQFEREVDRLSKLISSLQPTAKCVQHEGEERFSISLSGKGQFTGTLADVDLRVWPISLGDRQSLPLDLSKSEWARFPAVSFEAITPFFAVQISDRNQPELSRSFLILATLDGAPANRRERLLASMLSDRQRVLRYLLLLLLGSDSEELLKLLRNDSKRQLSDQGEGVVWEGTLLETLLEALATDPSRIQRVTQVVDELRNSPAGTKVLPEGFDVIWEPIREFYQSHFADQPKPSETLDTIEPTSVAQEGAEA